MNTLVYLAFSVLFLISVVRVRADSHDDDHGHDHDHDHPYEYAGLFKVTPGSHYSFSFSKTESSSGFSYAYEHIKMAFLVTESSTFDEELEETAEEIFKLNTTVEVSSTSPVINPGETLHELEFDPELFSTSFKLFIPGNGPDHLAVFSEHHPDEFGDELELFSETGEMITAFLTEPSESSSSDDKDWGKVILFSILANLFTLVGVIFLIPGFKIIQHPRSVKALASFASGALAAAAFFLIFPESSAYIQSQWGGEIDTTWRWGTTILCGYVSGFILDILFHPMQHSEDPKTELLPIDLTESHKGTASFDTQSEASSSMYQRINKLALLVLVGDFFHNFVDGVLLGAAFKSCSDTVAYSVFVGIISHELSQELADYLLLVHHGGLVWYEALSLNFLSGTSLILGAIIVTASDLSDGALGIVLAFGGGIYLYLAFTECTSVHKAEKPDLYDKAWSLLAFSIGAIAIGLVLLDHEHCAGSESGHGHGHDH